MTRNVDVTRPYGPEFSRIYNRRWDLWCRMMWPFISAEVEKANPASRTWLDLCCGSGGLLQLAGNAGFEVAGVDLSPDQLRNARAKAPEADLHEADIRSARLGRRFGVVTCLFDSVNYLLTVRDVERAFRTAKRHLESDGIFIFDIKTGFGFQQEQAKIFNGRNETLVFETRFDAKSGRHAFDVTGFVREGTLYRRFDERHEQRAYEPAMIDGILNSAGFSHQRYDGETLKRVRKRTTRVYYVARP